MAAWDMSSLGLRTLGGHLWWRRQLGPHRAHQVDQMVTQIHGANPEIDLDFLRNYLGMRVASGVSLQDMRRSLRSGERPLLEGEGRGRRLVFRRAGAPESPLVQQILQSAEFNEMMDSIHREVIARLSAGAETESVWIQVQRTQGTLQFNIQRADLPAASRNPETMFRVGPDGVPVGLEGLGDAIVRQVLSEFGQELQSSGRAAMRQAQFERMPRRRRTPSRRLGSSSAVPPPPPAAAARPAAPAPAEASEVPTPARELTRTQRAMVDLISESSEYEVALTALRRDVQAQLSRPQSQAWVRATRSGESIRFQIFSEEPGVSSDAVHFRMDSEGRIADLNGNEPILRSLIELLPRIPPIPVAVRPQDDQASPDDVNEVHEDEIEELEEAIAPVTDEAFTLRPARVPAEARRVPPALSPREATVRAESRSGGADPESTDTFVRQMRARARSLPTPPDPESTLGLDRSGMSRLEGQRNNYERLMQELDKLANLLETHHRAGSDPLVFIEIDPNAADWFHIVRPAEFRRDPNRGYFVMRMVSGSEGEMPLPRLEGDPITDHLDLGFGIRSRDGGGVPRELSFADILRDLFAR